MTPRRIALILLSLSLVLTMLPQPAQAEPRVQARNWVIMDRETGVILDEQLSRQRTAMASLTKVMTALVAAEHGDMSQQVTIVQSDLIGEASAFLLRGETVSLRTLMHGLLMKSGNDAAMAIARAVGGSPERDDPKARERFIALMNEKAAKLGLVDTHFTNPHGLDQDGHFSTAYDLAVLTRVAIQDPDVLTPFGASDYKSDNHEYKHGNQLPLSYNGVVGGKTGWTGDAGLCLIEVVHHNDRDLIVVLIGSTFERWYADAADLLDYGLRLPSPATNSQRAAHVFRWWGAQVDGPVAAGEVNRSWIWGTPLNRSAHIEIYDEAPNGYRAVQYFDKGRMEVNDPLAPLSGGWYVTSGRLSWEMITGQRQIGDDLYLDHAPAMVPLAGDPDAETPTYASLKPLLDAPATEAGRLIDQQLRHDGTVEVNPSTTRHNVLAGKPIEATGHGVASVFQQFLDSHGPFMIDGQIVDAPLFEPAFALTGLPITEPYWLEVPVDGDEQDVLVQCFERRCLTYTPANPDGWRVEMSNLGQHYLRWLEDRTQIALPAMHNIF